MQNEQKILFGNRPKPDLSWGSGANWFVNGMHLTRARPSAHVTTYVVHLPSSYQRWWNTHVMCVFVRRSRKPLYRLADQRRVKWNNNRAGDWEERWRAGSEQAAAGGGKRVQLLEDDCNLSLLFQHGAAGERRRWGLFNLRDSVQASLSITQQLTFFTDLCSDDCTCGYRLKLG